MNVANQVIKPSSEGVFFNMIYRFDAKFKISVLTMPLPACAKVTKKVFYQWQLCIQASKYIYLKTVYIKL